jgi:hypothetical protein
LLPLSSAFFLLVFQRERALVKHPIRVLLEQCFVARIIRGQSAGPAQALDRFFNASIVGQTFAARHKKTGQLLGRRLRFQVVVAFDVGLAPRLGPLTVVLVGIQVDAFTRTFDVELLRESKPLALQVFPAEEQVALRFDQLQRIPETTTDRDINDRH